MDRSMSFVGALSMQSAGQWWELLGHLNTGGRQSLRGLHSIGRVAVWLLARYPGAVPCQPRALAACSWCNRPTACRGGVSASLPISINSSLSFQLPRKLHINITLPVRDPMPGCVLIKPGVYITANMSITCYACMVIFIFSVVQAEMSQQTWREDGLDGEPSNSRLRLRQCMTLKPPSLHDGQVLQVG